jgi:hypothetical protein
MFLGLAAAGLANAEGLVVSTGVIPLSGIVRDVQISGWLHVVVQYPTDPVLPPNPIVPTIHANLPAMDVVADDGLGGSYVTYGAATGPLLCVGLSCAQSFFSAFTLHQVPVKDILPPNPIRNLAFRVDLKIALNLDGTLNADLSEATVPSGDTL